MCSHHGVTTTPSPLTNPTTETHKQLHHFSPHLLPKSPSFRIPLISTSKSQHM